MRYRQFTFLAFLVLCGTSYGQGFNVGFTTQNGVPTGGFLSATGTIGPGRRFVNLGINTQASQLIGIPQFSFASGVSPAFALGAFGGPGFGFGTFPVGAGPRNYVPPARTAPTVDGFLAAAMRFDQNGDQQLDTTELENVGVAAWKELSGINVPQSANAKATAPSESVLRQVKTAFVKRSLTFDRDGNRSLNQAEARRMASALIRSLLK